MDILHRIRSAYAINRRIWNMALVFLVSSLILNYPWMINWLPESMRGDVYVAADQVLRYGVFLVLMWVKDSRTTGNGTPEAPYKLAIKTPRK